MKTAVLFLCHVVDEETIFRYNHLKKGCDQMGYDLFWAIDIGNSQQTELPNDIVFHKFSFDEYIEKFPNMEVLGLDIRSKSPIRNVIQASLFLFNSSHPNEYDYIWEIEYDVCYCGEWTDFFRKYDNDNADLIHTGNTFRNFDQHSDWIDFRIVPERIKRPFLDKGILCASLMCCTRISKQLIDDIVDFFNYSNDGHTLFWEWVWPTIALNNNRRMVQYYSNYFKFRPTIPADFQGFHKDIVYHPVKLDIKWKDVLNKNHNYWDGRLNDLNKIAQNNPKRIVVIPAGRRRFMEILMPYVLESKTASEIHIWFNPRNDQDAQYIKNELPKLSSDRLPIRIMEIPDRPNQWSINDFYRYATDENAVYLKLDDDDVWFSPNAIDNIFDFRIAHPEYFLVSPLIINNGASSCILKDKIGLTEEEKNKVDEEFHKGHLWWFRQPQMAIKSHEFLLNNLDTLENTRCSGTELPHTRFSINAISWFGNDMKSVVNKNQLVGDDEQLLSCDLPKTLGLKNYMMGDVICAHYAFGPQLNEIDKTDILDRYQKLSFERYWSFSRMTILNQLVKSEKMRYVICIPCGRKRFLELLMPHVIESKLADEIHLWYNPRNQEDANYIRNVMPSLDPRCRIVERPNNERPIWSIAEFHPIENDPDTVYLKVDDDDVWFEDGAIDKIFQFRTANLEYLVVSPLVINNGYCSYMLRNVFPFSEQEKEILVEKDSTAIDVNGMQWHRHGENAIKAHTFFLDNINDISKFRVHNSETSHVRFSVNAISWFGMDMKMIPFNFRRNDEEQQLSSDFTHLLELKDCIMGDVICAHYAFGPQINEVDKTDILDRYHRLPLPPRRNATKRTAVLFVCHIINDEAKFRYELLRKGCKEMGYDLFWAVDTMAITEEDLPKDIGIDFYPISYLRYEEIFPYMTFIQDVNRMDLKRWNNAPFLAYHLFVNDNPDKYNRIWVFEYDVCCYGEWADFFKKYEEDDADLICPSTTYTETVLPNNWPYMRTTEYLKTGYAVDTTKHNRLSHVHTQNLKQFQYNNCLSWTLLCGCRIDAKWHDKICEFFKKLPENDNSRHRFHMELAWPTIIKMNGGLVGTFWSNQFENFPKMTYDFNDYHIGTIYHAIKWNIEWKKILERIPHQ